MFVPVSDENSYRHIAYPYITWALIATNGVIFLLFQSDLFATQGRDPIPSFGMIPVVLSGAMALPEDLARVPSWLTPLTSSFIHGSWLHLIGNMLFLWVLGDNVEDDMGHLRYLAFYLLCAIFSSLAYAALALDSDRPLVGASGAISGIASAYLLLHPRSKLWILVLLRIPLRLSALWAIGAWIVFQAVSAAHAWFTGQGADIAWFAHLGGLLAGAVLVAFFKHPDAILFDRSSLPLVELEDPSETAPR